MTNKPKDGGSAFPENVALCPNTGQVYPASEFHADRGMTLRQWYAGQALQGLLSYHGMPRHGFCCEEIFKIADAMIAHEDKNNG
jgi:hypothetical protein